MRVAIFGRSFGDSFIPNIQVLFNTIKLYGWDVTIYEPFKAYLQPRISMDFKPDVFNKHEELRNGVDFMISIGGDGTFLEAATIIRDSGVPILGVNTGRLGFLASTSKDSIEEALQDVNDGKYRLQDRSLLKLVTDQDLFGDDNFALNELTVHKKETSSMITIHTYIGDLYLNSYWADGLIISTPTGSTAYSLSCGGPIIVPGAQDYVITPIAPHNLNVRPVVVPDSRKIRLKIEGRGRDFLCSLDSRSVTLDSSIELTVEKADFHINVIQTEGQNFLSTIRNKMLWGLDIRN